MMPLNSISSDREMNVLSPATAYYALPGDASLPFWRRSAGLTGVIGLHAGALLLLFGMAANPELIKPLQTLTVRMLEMTPVPTPAPQPSGPRCRPATTP